VVHRFARSVHAASIDALDVEEARCQPRCTRALLGRHVCRAHVAERWFRARGECAAKAHRELEAHEFPAPWQGGTLDFAVRVTRL